MDLKEFDALLHDAEVKMKRLKALYEQWFQGIERIEPGVARKDLERQFGILDREKPRNTAARFRLQQLVARYSLYTTLWGRIARQIEEGTYERDVRRAHRGRASSSTQKEAKAYAIDLDEEIDVDTEDLAVEDDIASMLSALDARPAAPAPAPKPMLSAFSSFGLKRPAGAPPSNGPAAAPRPGPSPMLPAARPTPSPSPPVPAAQPAAAAPVARPLGSLPATSPLGGLPPKPAAAAPAAPATPAFQKKTVTATFGKPRSAAPPPSTRASLPQASGGTRPGPPAAPSSAASRPAADDGIKRLYESYVDARRRNNESVDNVAYDKLAASVRQMQSKLREKHGEKHIDFEVVVQNGKVGIKPKIG